MIRRTHIRVAILALVLALAATVAGPLPATAQEGPCTGIDRSGTRCRLSDGAAPAPAAGEVVVRSSGAAGPTFQVIAGITPCEAAGGAGWTPQEPLSAVFFDIPLFLGAAPFTEPGQLALAELILPSGVATDTGYLSCVGDGDPLPAPPPAPPTTAEIWDEALTFEPEVNLDPFVRGLTGLETFMWYEGPTVDSVVLSLGGYTVNAAIETDAYRWDMDGPDRDGEHVYQSTSPGSADAPAADHTYALSASMTVVHEVDWSGTATLFGPGIPAGGVTFDLGTATVATAREYEVIEVRTPLVRGGEADGES